MTAAIILALFVGIFVLALAVILWPVISQIWLAIEWTRASRAQERVLRARHMRRKR